MEDIRTSQENIHTKAQDVKFDFQNCRGKKRGRKEERTIFRLVCY